MAKEYPPLEFEYVEDGKVIKGQTPMTTSYKEYMIEQNLKSNPALAKNVALFRKEMAKLRADREREARAFKPEEETTGGKIARNIYKYPRQIGAQALGAIPDFYNFVMGAREHAKGTPAMDVVSKAMPQPIQALALLLNPILDQFPRFPESMTTKGIKKGIFDPLGEKMFGEGSMKKQEGSIEGAIDIGAKWAPQMVVSALTGGMSSVPAFLGKVGINLGTGIAGQAAKECGLGKLGQGIVEMVANTGLGLGSKLFGRAGQKGAEKVATGLKTAEQKAWTETKRRATVAPVTKTTTGKKTLSNLVLEIEDKQGKAIHGNRHIIKEVLTDLDKDIFKGEASTHALLDRAKNINSLLNKPSIASDSGAVELLKELKDGIYEQVDHNVGGIYKKARETSTMLKETPIFREALKRISDEAVGGISPEKTRGFTDTISLLLGTLGTTLLKGHFKTGLGLLASAVAPRALKNIKYVLSHPLMRKEAFKVAKQLGLEQTPVIAKKISKAIPEIPKPKKPTKKSKSYETKDLDLSFP